MGWKAKNIEKTYGFYRFFAFLGGSEEVSEHLGGCLGGV